MEGKAKPKAKKPNKKSPSEQREINDRRGCLFPIFLLLSCLVIFVVSFSILVGFMQHHTFDDLISLAKGEEISEETTAETDSESVYISTDKLLNMSKESLYNTDRSGVISQISLGANTIELYDIDNGSSVFLSFNNNTEIKDENDNKISINKINEGDLVIFVYDETKTLLSIKLNPDAEEITSLAVTVNTARKMVKIGDEAYNYNKDTVFRYKDSVLSPKDITEFDIVTVKSIDYDAWSVVMEKSHGVLKFTNCENIPDATYSVDEGDFNKIPESKTINLTEGFHRIIIQSPSISDYKSQIIVKPNEESELNLSGVQILRGSLIVDTVATGATLYVDGVQRAIGNPMFLNYGSHKVTLTRPDDSITQNVSISKEETKLNMNF